jgi:hypothetical protein
MTKFQLADILFNQGTRAFNLMDSRGTPWNSCYVSSIQREDGSGKSFNITIDIRDSWGGPGTSRKVIHVRTID